jgi:predicted ATPase
VRVLGLTGRTVVIQKVSFRNFKAYRSLDLELEPFTVLVGPNASGKTTLLEGLRLIACQLGQEFKPKELLASRSYGVESPPEMGVVGIWNGKKGSAHIESERNRSPAVGTPDWEFSLKGEWKEGGRFSAGHSSLEVGWFKTDPGVAELCAALSTTAVLRFESRQLVAPSYSEAEVPSIESDGSGLASVLAHLKLSSDETFDEIEFALKQVVPAVRRIRIERAAVEQVAIRTISLDEQRHEVPEKRTLWGHKIVLDMRGAKGVAADAGGEGTLMVLGLLTVLMGPRKPRLVLLDDIELGLHPAAQAKLIEVLRKLQQRDPELQIIATSHSPFILNYLDPKEVRMTFLAENGFARCEKLTAHPDFERWKDLMSPGEFWSTVGESWLEKAGETATHE